MYSNTRLLTLAGVMMSLVGALWLFLYIGGSTQRLMLAMAFGLLAGALSIKKQKGIEPDEQSKDDLLQ